MDNIKANPYVSVELEIIRCESIDIITTSGSNGFVPDDNEDDSW